MITSPFHVLEFDQVESTQDIAHEYARQGKTNIAVRANQQISGRGRGGNVWISPLGNLFVSLVIRPKVSPRDAGQYSFLTSVALRRAMVELCSLGVSFAQKWPNDVLCEGKKCAGILLEIETHADQTLNYMIIGLGVNIISAPPEKACLVTYSSQAFSADIFLQKFLENFSNLQEAFLEKGFSPVRQEWLDHAVGIGSRIQARLPQGVFEGIFEGLNDVGALILRLDNGQTRVIHSGDIFLECNEHVACD